MKKKLVIKDLSGYDEREQGYELQAYWCKLNGRPHLRSRVYVYGRTSYMPIDGHYVLFGSQSPKSDSKVFGIAHDSSEADERIYNEIMEYAKPEMRWAELDDRTRHAKKDSDANSGKEIVVEN